MKWLTLVVPCYNSQAYMKKSIDSLLSAGEDVEIIIVNDGSTDQTAMIAEQYKKDYPKIVKVIHKSNGGHGSGLNCGIKHAIGKYFRVVDSDDWVNTEALKCLIETIKRNDATNQEIDLYITNFIYDKVIDNTSFVRKFDKKFKPNVVTTWSDIKRFRGSELILMHSLTFKTSILKAHDMPLPEHTFYVDNLYAYQYLPHVKKMYYIDIDLYHYFIGRDDQSVNYVNFVNRYHQQIRVMLTMIKRYTYQDIMQMEKGLRQYMIYCLSTIMIVTILFTTAKFDKDRKKDLEDMWYTIKMYDCKLYKKLRFFAYPALVNWLPFKIRGFILMTGYRYLTSKVKLG